MRVANFVMAICALIAGAVLVMPSSLASQPWDRGTMGPTLKPDAVYKCLREGGRLSRVGELRIELCMHPYKDGGKLCSKKADCEGGCMAARILDHVPPITNGLRAEGKCAIDKEAQYGCPIYVENGVTQLGACE